jgi:hypothetical protein
MALNFPADTLLHSMLSSPTDDVLDILDNYCVARGYVQSDEQNTIHESSSPKPDECLSCNALLEEAQKEKIRLEAKVQELTSQTHEQQVFIHTLLSSLQESQHARLQLSESLNQMYVNPPVVSISRSQVQSPKSSHHHSHQHYVCVSSSSSSNQVSDPTPSSPSLKRSRSHQPPPKVQQQQQKPEPDSEEVKQVTFIQHESSEIHSWIENYQARKRRKQSTMAYE